MVSNRLQLIELNHAKTEVLWCSSSRQQYQIPSDPVRIGSIDVQPVSSVRDLRVYIDADMSMRTHVTAVVRSCFCDSSSNQEYARIELIRLTFEFIYVICSFNRHDHLSLAQYVRAAVWF